MHARSVSCPSLRRNISANRADLPLTTTTSPLFQLIDLPSCLSVNSVLPGNCSFATHTRRGFNFILISKLTSKLALGYSCRKVNAFFPILIAMLARNASWYATKNSHSSQ
ncbi:hypothetical protein RclHR1_07280014 [Rhizophagus clarus]|uniref:Uncharacterized protein n=1 Tax=Rhizophagus clarus TaxID=94130 RepID=A0A2Z6SKM1_9GLOM|nr:hypothetical protein RclHR1_07280014 [Rhizophagus clarus]